MWFSKQKFFFEDTGRRENETQVIDMKGDKRRTRPVFKIKQETHYPKGFF